MRQLLCDGGFEVTRMVRSIGLATGVRRDLLAGAAIVASPGPTPCRAGPAPKLLFKIRKEPVRNHGLCRAPLRARRPFRAPSPDSRPGSKGARKVVHTPMAQTCAAKYLLKAAASAPRDLINAAVATIRPIHPTVLIFHCTFVCDAQCEMCSNWTRGNRKEDMTLEEISRVFDSPLWKNIEVAFVSGEADHRNDLVDICKLMLDKLRACASSASTPRA